MWLRNDWGWWCSCFRMMNNDDYMTCMERTQGSGMVTTDILAGRDECEPTHLRSTGPRDMSVTWWDPDKMQDTETYSWDWNQLWKNKNGMTSCLSLCLLGDAICWQAANNWEKNGIAKTKFNSKVSSTDDTCYLIYRRTRVTTLGPDNNDMWIR